jgi:hypothetical protein
MSAINWTQIYKKYKGLWVALLDDEITVVGHGKTLKEASDMARKKGHDHPIFTRMPPSLSAYAGGAL